MSALTKIFVVLLVVLSLMVAAGTIVFVNRQENYKVAAEMAAKAKALAESKATAKDQDILKVNAEKNALAAELTNQINALKTAVANGEAGAAQLQQQITEKNDTTTQLTASISSANEALKVAQADIKARQEGYNALLTEKDKSDKDRVEEGNRITELTNALEVTTRQSRYVQEQISALQQQNAQMAEMLRKYNISPTGATAPPGGAINTTPSANINGVVRDFKTLNGVPFATISLGSADAVTRGMKFNVVDPGRKQFLGYFTVDSVGVHEATGRLDGPAVDQIRPNVSEVRTQL